MFQSNNNKQKKIFVLISIMKLRMKTVYQKKKKINKLIDPKGGRRNLLRSTIIRLFFFCLVGYWLASRSKAIDIKQLRPTAYTSACTTIILHMHIVTTTTTKKRTNNRVNV